MKFAMKWLNPPLGNPNHTLTLNNLLHSILGWNLFQLHLNRTLLAWTLFKIHSEIRGFNNFHFPIVWPLNLKVFKTHLSKFHF